MPAAPQSLKELFLDALSVAPAERAAWLERACADPELRRQARLMLAAHDSSHSLLDRPAPVLAPAGVATEYFAPTEESPGTVIGPYKLLEQIGEGGFGVVFMAEQTEPVRRKVALKIIKPGMDTRQVIARFEAERQALALMDHPNIARVLDAGATDSGRPVLRDGTGPRRPDHRVLRPEPPAAARAAGAVHRRLPGGAARAPEGDHPPRPQAVQRAGDAARRHAGGQGDRLRHRQGDSASS